MKTTTGIARRDFILSGAASDGALLLAQAGAARAVVPGAPVEHHGSAQKGESQVDSPLSPGMPGEHYTPVVVPSGKKLPWKVMNGVKVYHLIAEEVEHEFAPGLKATCWGYNGSVHGPVIEAVEGDRVRIYVTNKLAAPTTVHWHGVLLPSGMDGVGGPEGHPAWRDVQMRVCSPPARHSDGRMPQWSALIQIQAPKSTSAKPLTISNDAFARVRKTRRPQTMPSPFSSAGNMTSHSRKRAGSVPDNWCVSSANTTRFARRPAETRNLVRLRCAWRRARRQ